MPLISSMAPQSGGKSGAASAVAFFSDLTDRDAYLASFLTIWKMFFESIFVNVFELRCFLDSASLSVHVLPVNTSNTDLLERLPSMSTWVQVCVRKYFALVNFFAYCCSNIWRRDWSFSKLYCAQRRALKSQIESDVKARIFCKYRESSVWVLSWLPCRAPSVPASIDESSISRFLYDLRHPQCLQQYEQYDPHIGLAYCSYRGGRTQPLHGGF